MPNPFVQSTSPAKYLPEVDGLRAVAVLAVIYAHFGSSTTSILQQANPGELGVRLFFVISGFLITGILLSCRDRVEQGESINNGLKIFYARRLLRIFPLYYATLLIMALLRLPSVREQFPWHVLYLSNVYFFWTKGRPYGDTSHLWTLAVEEQFYLLWPLLMLYIPRRMLVATAISSAILGTAFRGGIAVWSRGDCNPWPLSLAFVNAIASADALCLGSALALIRDRFGLPACLRFVNLCALTGGLCIATTIGASNAPSNSIWTALRSPLWSMGITLALTWLVHRAAQGASLGVFSRILSAKPVIAFGRISYGIYLFHNFVPFGLQLLDQKLNIARPSTDFGWFISVTMISTVCATISWFLFESPINGLKKYFVYRDAVCSAPLHTRSNTSGIGNDCA